jgi:hypothetical protein
VGRDFVSDPGAKWTDTVAERVSAGRTCPEVQKSSNVKKKHDKLGLCELTIRSTHCGGLSSIGHIDVFARNVAAPAARMRAT